MEARLGKLCRHGLKVLPSRPRPQHHAILLQQRAGDGQHLRRELARAKNHLRKAAPAQAVRIHTRKTEIDETHGALSGSILGCMYIRSGIIFESVNPWERKNFCASSFT